MPRISAFCGMVVWMYYQEGRHRGRPHFHVIYGKAEATIDIDAMTIIAGALPPRQRRLVLKWARRRERELRENWARARREEPLLPIDPPR